MFKIIFSKKDGKQVKCCEPVADEESFLALIQSADNAQMTERVRHSDRFKSKDARDKVKRRLVQMSYSCLPNDDGTLKGTTRLSNHVFMDVDCPKELEERDEKGKIIETPTYLAWKAETLQKLMEGKGAIGGEFLIDSVTKGFHQVFRRRKDMTHEENLRWASEKLGVPFDENAKDFTRVVFEPSGKIYYIEQSLFDNSECTDAKKEGTTTHTRVGEEQKKVSVAVAVVAPENMPTYHGFPLSDICKKYLELFNDGKQPEKGDRNVKTFELAMTLRSICGYSVEELMKAIPRYDDFPEDEYIATLENACREPRKGMPYRLTQVLKALKGEQGVKAAGGTLTTPPPMPKKLPRLLQLLTRNVPNIYKPIVASAVFPALAIHLHGVWFKYWDNVRHECTFENVRISGQSSGKSSPNEPINHIIARIVERDKPNRSREAEWKRKNPSGRGSAKDPRPKDICIQILPSDLTNAVFHQRVVDVNNNGQRYLYLTVDEIEALKKCTSRGTTDEVYLLIKQAFDNSMVGQDRVGPDSVSGMAPLRWNWNASTTPTNARKFFAKGVNDGTVGRLDICTIYEDGDDDTLPIMGDYDEKFDAELSPYLDRLEQANGFIECQQAKKLSLDMKKENDDNARLYDSDAYRVFSRRANVIAWLKGMLLYIADGYHWSKEIADFVKWSQAYNMWCKMLYFGQQLEDEIRQENAIQRASHPQNLLNLLPDVFTLEQFRTMRQEQGREGDGNSTLRSWKQRGYIGWDDIQQCYVKTEKYILR